MVFTVRLATQLRQEKSMQELIDTFVCAGLATSDVSGSEKEFHALLTKAFFQCPNTEWEHLVWVCHLFIAALKFINYIQVVM